MNQINKPRRADLERAIHERHIQRVRAISTRSYGGKPGEQQAARNADLPASELQAARELQFLHSNA